MKFNLIGRTKNQTILRNSLVLWAIIFTTLTYADSHQNSTKLSNKQNSAHNESLTRVYKVTQSDGSISYSDQPQTNSEELLIQPIATVPAFRSKDPESAASGTEARTTNYQSLTILDPAHNSARNSGSGDLSISIKLIPSLGPGDQLRFLLDGRIVATQTSHQVSLQNISRGSHILRVQVISSQGRELLSASSDFTLHRPIARAR